MEQWDEIWFNFDHQLVKRPDPGHPIPGTYVHALPLETSPQITVYYHVNERDQIITLLHIAKV